ncbi:D-glycero-beta-D-manno-heptose-7-phosphate kinase [Burkholderia sp. Nafp2/4-1b]|nr:D-glycero-beta-D-manno-heptose-7-phosphate kinase [Burkholderia sp. Nafp2/4-1b]RKT99059.1 D-glycero-beta-D-manno-heptose-7-phosphate kinase [Burkholderia sp. Nafp2/4-1b]
MAIIEGIVNTQPHILVVGDVILDQYWFGNVNRISPEAPVPVVAVQRTEDRLGGSANVAHNCARLGATATLLAVAGRDANADTIVRLCRENDIDARLCVDDDLHTTVKLRVVGHQQQLLRLDFERTPAPAVLAQISAAFDDALPSADVVIFLDYHKGALDGVQVLIQRARAQGKMVFVDPKGDDYERYRGATLLTPNLSEFKAVAGRFGSEAELTSKAEALREQLSLDKLLVTRSEEGMTLFDARGAHQQPAKAREVFDVSGAGDTVIATLAVRYATHGDWLRAMHEANVAAGVVVGKLGTAAITLDELENALAAE